MLLGGLLIGVLLGVSILFTGADRSANSRRGLPPAIGSPVQDFELPILTGGSQRLSALKGKPVVINFWASWCAPCKEEMPLLDRLSQNHSGDLAVLGVNYAETPEVVQEFVQESGISFPILLDETGRVSDLYYVRNYPTTFFIDADGVLRAQHIGLLSEEALARYLSLAGIE